MPTASRSAVASPQPVQRIAEGAEEPGQAVDIGLRRKARKRRGVVATRFSSAKPAPDGACVRSPSTHQRPSGPRPISKATKCRKWPERGLTPDHRAQPFRVFGDQAGGQMAIGAPAGFRRRDRPPPVSSRSARWIRPAAMPSHSVFGSRIGNGLSGQSRVGSESGAIVAKEHARIAQILFAAGEVAARSRPASGSSRCAIRPAQTGRMRAVGIHQFVRHAGQGAIAGRTGATRSCFSGLCPWHQSPAARRRSSVIGNSRCGVSGGGS